MSAPDLTVFRDAQQRLRQSMGVDVTFQVPVPPVWPPDTQINPETGRPYDPTVDPESGGGHTPVVKRVGLIYKPISTEDAVSEERSGVRRDKALALAVEVGDYPDIEDATEVTVGGVDYAITDILRDPGLDARYLAYAETR